MSTPRRDTAWVVVVDGSNVAQSATWTSRHAQDPRSALVEALRVWSAQECAHVQLVFDGAGPLGVGEQHAAPMLLVDGAGAHNGDARVIERARAAVADGARCWVVSDDRAVGEVAGVGAELVLSCDGFIARMSNIESVEGVGATRGESESPSGLSPLADSLSDPVRAQLERLRRGQ